MPYRITIAAAMFWTYATHIDALLSGLRGAAAYLSHKAASGAGTVYDAPWSTASDLIDVLLGCMVVFSAALIASRPFFASLRGDVTAHRASVLRLERRHRCTVALLVWAAACGNALTATGWERQSRIEQAKLMLFVEYEIRRAWRTTRAYRPLPTRQQRRELKSHAGQVISALRAAAARIDASPDDGLRALGEMLLSIAKRCAEGRVGALLDDDQLQGHEPIRDYEGVRVVTVALFIAAITVGVSLLHLSSSATTGLTSTAGLITIAVVYRRAARRGMETLGFLFGAR
jgi:hypothetical protein